MIAATACALARRPPAAPAAAAAPSPQETDPFEEGSSSFVVSGPRFVPGETAIVRVCVTPSGEISSADLIGSSGDKRFDDFALIWARQVKLSNASAAANTRDVCGSVRVEIRAAPLPDSLGGRSNALS